MGHSPVQRKKKLGIKEGQTLEEFVKEITERPKPGKSPQGRKKGDKRVLPDYPEPPPLMKKCPACSTRKPRSEFYRQSYVKSGYSKLCKKCWMVKRKWDRNLDGTCPNENPKGTYCKHRCSKRCKIFDMHRRFRNVWDKIKKILKEAKKDPKSRKKDVRQMLANLDEFFVNANDMPSAKDAKEIKRLVAGLETSILALNSRVFNDFLAWVERIKANDPSIPVGRWSEKHRKDIRWKKVRRDYLKGTQQGKDKTGAAIYESDITFEKLMQALKGAERLLGVDIEEAWASKNNWLGLVLRRLDPTEDNFYSTNTGFFWRTGWRTHELGCTFQEALDEFHKHEHG